MKKPRKQIPTLETSPFAPVKVVDQNHLSDRDREVLEKAEAAIDRGQKTFLEVAKALVRIRDYRDGLLYKRKYGKWEAYCTERWEFGRSYASRLTTAAEIVKLLPMGNNFTVTERQIRPLARLPSTDLRKRLEIGGSGSRRWTGVLPTCELQ